MDIQTHVKQNWHLAYPVMLSQLGHVMMGVTDNIMVGHVGVTSLAAAGLALVAFNFLFLFGIGVSFAITPLVAEAHGENNDSKIIDVMRHGVIINGVNGVVLFSVVYFGKNVLYHLNQPVEVVDLAIPYLNIVAFSLIPVMIFQSYKQFAEGLSRTQLAMIVIFATNIINIGLNYIFIYGHAGAPAMGLVGAGWATLISRFLMMAMIILYIYYSPTFYAYRSGFSFEKYSKRLFNTLLSLGIPSGFQFILEVAAFDFSLVMMGWLGKETLAAHQIAINLATISYMTTAGLAASATIRVGYFLGKKDVINMRLAARTLLGMAIAIMACWSIIFIAGRYLLPSLYVDNENVISIASTLLIVAGLFQLADGTQVVSAASLRGLQDVFVPSIFILIAYWVIGLPVGYWLAFHTDYGAVGIWIGLLLGLTLTAIAMFLRFRMLSGKIVSENGR